MPLPKNFNELPLDQQEKLREAKREAARRSYQKNREQRIAKVAEYKKGKRKEREEKQKKEEVAEYGYQCTGFWDHYNDNRFCEKLVPKSLINKTGGRCKKCAKQIELIREKYRKGFLKWVSKNGYYEKSVRITSDWISRYEYSELYKRCVLEIRFKESRKELEEDDAGYFGFKYATGYSIDGYYRSRTDCRFYYPEFGISGIPDMTRSQFGKDYEKHVNDGERRARAQKLQREIEKLREKDREHERRRRQIFEEWQHKRTNREIKKRQKGEQGSGFAFFRMQAAAQSISEYATNNNQ